MNRRHVSRLVGIAAFLLVLGIARLEHAFWGGHFNFDDAFMYVRYAYNFRHGWGIAWNPAGPHTFGVTSLPWFFIILAGSYFVADAPRLLTTFSCATGLLAIGTICLLIRSHARSAWARQPLLLMPWISLPLLLNQRFAENWSNGMETMLGMLVLTLFLAAHRFFTRTPGWMSSGVLGVAACLTVLTRPELILVCCTLPLLFWLLYRQGSLRHLAGFLAVFAATLAAVLAMNLHYFGTAVPLAFYLKAQHGYTGFSLLINPWTYAAIFCAIGMPALLLLTALPRRRDWRMLAVFLLPLLVQIV